MQASVDSHNKWRGQSRMIITFERAIAKSRARRSLVSELTCSHLPLLVLSFLVSGTQLPLSAAIVSVKSFSWISSSFFVGFSEPNDLSKILSHCSPFLTRSVEREIESLPKAGATWLCVRFVRARLVRQFHSFGKNNSSTIRGQLSYESTF